MKKLNTIAAVTTAAAIALTNTATAFAGNTGTYTYFGSLSEICETQAEAQTGNSVLDPVQPENNGGSPSQTPEVTTRVCELSAEATTAALPSVPDLKPETKPLPETSDKEEQPPTEETTVKLPFTLPELTTKEYITETTTKAAAEAAAETTTKAVVETTTETTTKQTETTTVKQTQTTTEAQTETTTAAQSSGSASNSTSSSKAAQEILQLVNEERAAAGLSSLTLDSSLTNAAQLKAQDMADNNYFSHTSPTYGTPFQMLTSLGISYKAAGENIAMGQKSAEAVMTAWMNSEGHKANILSSSYGKLGVGYVNQNGTTYWVQIFTD
ncbi:MAG: CAP domain-containing protein [Clostridiales bacterium]|nr:CAP domain-containing protein [Clostridiales bacterium]